MFCVHCGKEIPDGAKFCPLCGGRVPAPSAPPVQPAPPAEEPAPAAAPVSPAREQSSLRGETVLQAVGGEDAGIETGKGKKAKKAKKAKKTKKAKKSSAGRTIGIILLCLVLVAAAVLVALNYSAIPNLVKRTFSSPKEYYHYVESRAADKAAEALSKQYGAALEAVDNQEGTAVAGSVQINVGKKVWSLAEEEMGLDYDMDWLSSVRLDYDTASAGNMTKFNGALALNGDSLISLESVLSREEETLWLKAPELSTDYVEFDMSVAAEELSYSIRRAVYSAFGSRGVYFADMLMASLNSEESEAAETAREVVKALPDEAKLQQLLDKYLRIVIESVKDVQKGRGTLEAGGVSAAYTQLTVNIDEDDAITIVENVTTAILADKELEKYIVGVADALGRDGDDVYDDLMERIEYINDNADDIQLDEKLTMTLWVNLKGEIVGRQVKYEDWKFLFAMPRKGTRVGLEVSAKEDGDKLFSLAGSGKLSGTSLTGSFELEVEENSVANIELTKLNLIQAAIGYVDGSLVITPAKSLVSELYLPSSLESLVKKLSLDVDFSTAKDGAALRLALVSGSDELLAIDSQAATESAKKISSIKGAYTLDEWKEEVDESDVEELISRLEKSDLPEDITEYLASMLEDFFA